MSLTRKYLSFSPFFYIFLDTKQFLGIKLIKFFTVKAESVWSFWRWAELLKYESLVSLAFLSRMAGKNKDFKATKYYYNKVRGGFYG
mgnify:CR=1 FL=1